jgi:hypothetical protein
VAWDSAALRDKDAEDRAAMAKMEAWERVSRVEVEKSVALASAHEDVEGLVWKIVFLECQLAEERRAREVAEENSRNMSEAAADAKHRWEVSERERQEQFEELTLLQTQGFELCHAIVGPLRVRNQLSKRMRLVALHHTELDGEIAVLRAVMSSATESVLGHSPNEIFQVEVVDELVAEF